jgi:hypothetical protein
MYIASLSSWGVHQYGSRVGGQRAAATNKSRYGESFYQEIGRAGGKKSRGGGFAANPELAREAGRKGGRKSRGGGRKPAAA